MSEENKTTETQQTPEQSFEDALSKVDLEKLTTAEIFQDIVQQTKVHSMRMMVAVALLERKIASETQATQQKETDEPKTPDLQVVENQA